MAVHPQFPASPYAPLIPEHRWFPAAEELRGGYEKLLPPLVARIREGVQAWRDSGYSGASGTSRTLLRWWFDTEHLTDAADGTRTPFRYYFAQREAVETVIWLHEVRKARDKYDLIRLDASGAVSTGMFSEDWPRYVCKLATGAGKTKVLSLLIAWSFFHKTYEPDSALARNFLLIAPNIIVLERLRADFDGFLIFFNDPVLPDNGMDGRNWRDDFQLALHLQDDDAPGDADGVVLITTTPEWRFRTTRTLSDARRRQLAEQQTTRQPLQDMPFAAADSTLIRVRRDGGARLYAHETDASMGLGWTLHLLWPADQMMSRAVGAARILAGLSIALLAGLTGILLRRRQRARNREVEAVASRAELERQVALRTAELSSANQRLNHEMEERRSLERNRQVLEDELVQANKLATVGQIAAGVAHEINQPLAAIRTHADTAGVYMERNDPDSVRRSLTSISGLTEKVGTITDELRAFARKTRSEVVAVDVEDAINGALLLVSARLKERGIWLDRSALSPGLKVKAERNRLEQVVLNLLQNAIEALEGTETPTIALSSKRIGKKVVIRLTDNGPGLAEAVQERLFTPFVTSKAAGLGLGLVISRDIVAGFGGELIYEPAPVGTVFQITLANAA